jgi:hypothetical protein
MAVLVLFSSLTPYEILKQRKRYSLKILSSSKDGNFARGGLPL